MSRFPSRTRLATVAVAAALAAALSLSACSDTSEGASGSAPVAATAQHRTAADFASAASAPGTVVLDVRTPAEFAAGHLPGAVNIDASAADFRDRLDALDQGETYAVYCQSGRRSAAALATMVDMGFRDAFDLQGGIGAWASAGGEVVTGP